MLNNGKEFNAKFIFKIPESVNTYFGASNNNVLPVFLQFIPNISSQKISPLIDMRLFVYNSLHPTVRQLYLA